MNSCEQEILNILYSYAEYIDSGRLEDAAALFRHARLKVLQQGDLLDEHGVLALWKSQIILYPCGTPRTKHVVTNPVIHIDADGKRAESRSYYTVFQQTDTLPLQVIAAGRYHDQFERVSGQWRICYRDYSLFDLPGDLSQHLTNPP